jgi:hypothetical protein
MGAWQQVHEQTVLIEREVALVLLLLAGLLAGSALRSLTSPSDLRLARAELAQRVTWVGHAARYSRTDYIIALTPASGHVRAMRLTRGEAKPRLDRPLSGLLSNGVVVESTTLMQHSITISDQGFALSTGRITLLATNGDRITLDIGDLGLMKAGALPGR